MSLNQNMNIENVAYLHHGIETKGIMKFAGKWMELENNHPE